MFGRQEMGREGYIMFQSVLSALQASCGCLVINEFVSLQPIAPGDEKKIFIAPQESTPESCLVDAEP